MEGQILGNRYELIEKIGGGGMALVYKAKCRMLNRFVAIKMLRPEFTNDEEFVKRFIIEAQSAASLSHPNIVSIYDVGHEGDIHYIVMEYIDGITLKEYVTQKGVLKWREAVNITIQICSAIEHAHRNHIVHRDIKPHNILLTRDGIAKVADFGIARAVSSSTITMAGSTIGSVHYFSPEQARGGYIDEKSDLYSLGITLYEMVTGKLPFDGETPVAVALKHIQVEPQPPIEIDNNIPKGVNNIIMKAIKKDQRQRYQTASDMLEDLYLVLKQPDGEFITEEAVEDFPTRRVKAISEDSLSKEGRKSMNIPEDAKKKGDRVTVVLAVITSLIIIAIFGFIAYKLVVPSVASQKEFEMKNYVGRNIDEVKQELAAAGFTHIQETPKNDDNYEKDSIISQNPVKGVKLKSGDLTTIQFVVSDGPKLVKIPDLEKRDSREAANEIRNLGLTPQLEEVFDDTIVKELVVKTDPAAWESVKPDSTVTIYVSKGPELKTVIVPDLIGKTKDAAEKLLAEAKLKEGTVYPEDGKNYVDKIIKQDPKAGTELNEEDAVDIYLQVDSSQEQMGYRVIMINLSETAKYSDTIKVFVLVTPSTTSEPVEVLNETKEKTEFPISLSVPVPQNGKSVVRVYLDNKLYSQSTVDLSGGQ